MPRTRCSSASARTALTMPPQERCGRASRFGGRVSRRFGGCFGGVLGLRATVGPLPRRGGLGVGLLARRSQSRVEPLELVGLGGLGLEGALGAGETLELLPVAGDLQQ